jgi:hypothetical protein
MPVDHLSRQELLQILSELQKMVTVHGVGQFCWQQLPGGFNRRIKARVAVDQRKMSSANQE